MLKQSGEQLTGTYSGALGEAQVKGSVKGDKVEILGSQVLAEGAPLLLAREVTRNGDIMLMRDDFGKPVWLGWPK